MKTSSPFQSNNSSASLQSHNTPSTDMEKTTKKPAASAYNMAQDYMVSRFFSYLIISYIATISPWFTIESCVWLLPHKYPTILISTSSRIHQLMYLFPVPYSISVSQVLITLERAVLPLIRLTAANPESITKSQIQAVYFCLCFFVITEIESFTLYTEHGKFPGFGARDAYFFGFWKDTPFEENSPAPEVVEPCEPRNNHPPTKSSSSAPKEHYSDKLIDVETDRSRHTETEIILQAMIFYAAVVFWNLILTWGLNPNWKFENALFRKDLIFDCHSLLTNLLIEIILLRWVRLWTRVSGDMLVRSVLPSVEARLLADFLAKKYICSFKFGLWKTLESSEKKDIDEQPTEVKSVSGLRAQVDQQIDEAMAGDKTQNESQAELMPAQETEEIQESVMITDIDLI
ncbi:hypothetical protein BS50DRAFT_585748 [Corynespora cassiicola Philippines]|uniref:Uncharacterized protein n=1 Tax=Corynespora cassiicola Philippines TaxID=1448308 RepID=A0A2T2NY11_CORCC|nr:hypothetical protein BS50DRAFT_585748 [Corynespora cassiicola Philippines]